MGGVKKCHGTELAHEQMSWIAGLKLFTILLIVKYCVSLILDYKVKNKRKNLELKLIIFQ